MVDTVKKFGFAGNVGPSGAKKPTPPKGGTEFDEGQSSMGMGVAAIAEILKESQDLRQGKTDSFNVDPGPPGGGQKQGGGIGQNFALDPSLNPASPEVLAMADQLTQNMIDRDTPDALSLGINSDDIVKTYQDLAAKETEAMSGSKGILSGLFDIAGIAAAAAGISNFSPALTMLGGKLGQEARALEDEITEPFRLAKANIAQQIAQEIEGGRDTDLSPKERIGIVANLGEELVGDKSRGALKGDAGAAIDSRFAGVGLVPTDAERASIADRIGSEPISSKALAEQKIPGFFNDQEQNAVDYQVGLLQEMFSPSKSDDTLMAEGRHDIVKLRRLRRTNPESANVQIAKKLRQETTKSKVLSRAGESRTQIDYEDFSFEEKTRQGAIDKTFGAEGVEPSPIFTESGRQTAASGAPTKEREFMSELLGISDPNETIVIPDNARIREETDLLNGVDETVLAEELADKMFDNWEGMAESEKVGENSHIVVAPMINEQEERTTSPPFGPVTKTDVWVEKDVRMFKERKSTPWSKLDIRTTLDSAVEEVLEKGLDLDNPEYKYFTGEGLLTFRKLLAKALAEL